MIDLAVVKDYGTYDWRSSTDEKRKDCSDRKHIGGESGVDQGVLKSHLVCERK